MPEFSIDLQSQPPGLIARLRGQASNLHAPSVRATLADVLKQGSSPVVIDLGELEFIASAALAELISFRKELAACGRRIRLAGARHQIHDLFQKTRLVELFPMYQTADDALKAD